MNGSKGGIPYVVVARNPLVVPSKTRLAAPGGLSTTLAAGLSSAMLECTLARLSRLGTTVLAITPDGSGESVLAAMPGPAPVQCVNQGDGDLSTRLARVWQEASPAGPIAFLGADSPDFPLEALSRIPVALARGSVAIGRARDGGYWVLAAPQFIPCLLRQIDWGTASVYDQTLNRAAEAGHSVEELPPWWDIDRPADLAPLRARLNRPGEPDAALERLAAWMDRNLPGSLLATPDRESPCPNPRS